MAFIDNSKDIIIDAVLTDLGRQRLSQGRFNVARFALGDDEINYKLFNPTAESAYTDLDILKTPVFEAFTNNISSMNSRLVTYSANDLLFLPVLKLNTKGLTKNSKVEGAAGTVLGGFEQYSDSNITNTFLVTVNLETNTKLETNLKIDGSSAVNTSYIRIDQGIDNNAVDVSKEKILPQDLLEEQYTLEIDNRFGFITFNNEQLLPSFIDDDNIALYNFNIFDNKNYVNKLLQYQPSTNENSEGHVLAGMRGSVLTFGIYASPDLQIDNSNLFDLYGIPTVISNKNYNIIHTTATVTGLKTGYSIDIPISFIKYISG